MDLKHVLGWRRANLSSKYALEVSCAHGHPICEVLDRQSRLEMLGYPDLELMNSTSFRGPCEASETLTCGCPPGPSQKQHQLECGVQQARASRSRTARIRRKPDCGPTFHLLHGAAGRTCFGDGLTWELIHGLTRIEGLSVVACNSAAQLRAKGVPDIAVIREKLNGTWTELMKSVVGNLNEEDMLDIAAYTSSLQP